MSKVVSGFFWKFAEGAESSPTQWPSVQSPRAFHARDSLGGIARPRDETCIPGNEDERR